MKFFTKLIEPGAKPPIAVTKIKHCIAERTDIMGNIKEPFNKFAIKLQESFLTIESKKRIQLMLQYLDITSQDVLLDVGGNTGKIRGIRKRLPRSCCLGTKTCGRRIW